MSKWSIEAYEYEENCSMYYVTANGKLTPDSPGTMYARNGDPGDPPEAGECITEYIHVEDEEGNEIDTDTLDYIYDWIEDMARSCAVDDYDDYYDDSE